MRPVICLFSRNLRLEDNRVLSAASAQGPVIPCFLQKPHVPGSFARTFIEESLSELQQDIASQGGRLLLIRDGDTQMLIETARASGCETLFTEEDYSPERQKLISSLSDALEVRQVGDRTLVHPASVLKQDGTPYQVFTPYLKKVLSLDADPPQKHVRTSWFHGDKKSSSAVHQERTPGGAVQGGRTAGLKALEQLDDLRDYPRTRDIPSLRTSRLSAHLAFGTVSPREAFMAAASLFGPDSVFAGELVWRDFWLYIAYHFPHVFTGSFIRKYDRLAWSQDAAAFQRWCDGTTGFPMVDAGMRELNSTGFMHNRLRMITASFLVKDLHIDWRWGEDYFSQKLIDYDPCVNNGNWQWSASTGCDAQPFFRVFNPWTQQKKFDPQALYMKQWIPELEAYAPKDIHRHEAKHLPGYPKPIADHSTERKIALDAYRSAAG